MLNSKTGVTAGLLFTNKTGAIMERRLLNMTRITTVFNTSFTHGKYVETVRRDSNHEHTKYVGKQMHEYLVGNKDYIDSNIVLNVDVLHGKVALVIFGEPEDSSGVAEALDVLNTPIDY